MFRSLSFLALLVLLVTLAHGEVYKWVDDQGRVHYGDKPVEHSRQLSVEDQSSGDSNVMTPRQRLERRQRLLQALEEDRLERDKKKVEQAQKKAQLERRCVVARDRLKNYLKAGRLYHLDKEGNRIALSAEERDRATRRLRENIEKHCN